MNTVEWKTLERKKVAQLARKYVKQGYDVFADLPEYRPPHEIEGFMPDLIVRKGNETIIIEVATSESLRSSDKAVRLAEYGSRYPNVRFDLVLANPQPHASGKQRIKVLERELDALYGRMLLDLEYAIGNELHDVAIVLASQILEGLLARVAERKAIAVPQGADLVTLARVLFEGQVISESVVEFCSDVQSARNQVVHAGASTVTYDGTDLTRDYLEEVRRKLIALVRQWD